MHEMYNFLSVWGLTFSRGNSGGFKCLSQQTAVTWTVCAGARRRGSGRPSGPWGSPSTGNSSTCTSPGLTTSSPRVWASRQDYPDTAQRDRCWWAGSVVSLILTCCPTLTHTQTALRSSGRAPLSQAPGLLDTLMLLISQRSRCNHFAFWAKHQAATSPARRRTRGRLIHACIKAIETVHASEIYLNRRV